MAKDSVLLGYDTVSVVNQIPTLCPHLQGSTLYPVPKRFSVSILLCFGVFVCQHSEFTGYVQALTEYVCSCLGNCYTHEHVTTQHLSVAMTVQHSSLVMSMQNNAKMAALVA